MTILANPGGNRDSGTVHYRVPFESVDMVPNRLSKFAAEYGTLSTSDGDTTYPLIVKSGIAVVFSTYCIVPLTTISDEPSRGHRQLDSM